MKVALALAVSWGWGPATATEPAATGPVATDVATDGAPADPAELGDPAESAEPGDPAESAELGDPAEAAEPGPDDVVAEDGEGAATDAPAEVAAEPEATPPSVEAAEADTSEFSVAPSQSGPPYHTQADEEKLRKRYGLEAKPPTDTRQARWKCLIADPTCGFNVEVNATSAYALRMRQGDVRDSGVKRWNSGRAQYDVWVNIPVVVETRGKTRYTRMTLGPKGGVIFSDTGSIWGNLGLAARYWLGRGRWAPTIEFSSALSYMLAKRPTTDLGGSDPKFVSTRGPVGFTADVGVGLGGFGAIVVGGQFESPLAREDVPERFRTSSGGMFFVGFRGNILWGGPAAAAVLTHGLTQRYAEEAR